MVFTLAVCAAYLTTHFKHGLSPAEIANGGYVFTLQVFVAVAALVGLVPPIVLGERDRTLAKLRDSENRYRSLTEAAFEGIFISENGRVVDVSDQGLKMFGYTREELVGKQLVELVTPDDLEVVAEALRTERETIYGHHLRRQDGSTFYGEAQSRHVHLGGRTLRMTALRDITERKMAEQALRESEEKFSKAFHTSPDVMSIADLETGRYIEVNAAHEKIFGFKREEVIGHSPMELGILLSAEPRERMLAELRAKGSVRDMEVNARNRHGEMITILHSAELVEMNGRKCVLRVSHDITDRIRAEKLSSSQRQVLEMIANGRPVRETLETLLQMIESHSPEMLCSILLLDEDGIHLRHGAAPSLPAEFTRVIDGSAIGPCVGSCGTAIFRREPVLVADIASDPLWVDYKEVALAHGLRACWSTPIIDAQRRVLGSYAIYSRRPGLPDERQQQLIAMATHTAVVCLSKHHTEAEREQSIAREQRARIEYTFQLIASQEAERKRIAVELHDSLGQNLLLIKNLAQMALREQEPAQTYERVASINHLVTQCIAETRQISRDLHPHQLDHLGLRRALESMLESVARASEIKFQWKFDDVDELFSAAAAMNVYRIVQESLNNILKHSHAQNVGVELARDIHEVQLRITDDGCGFVVGPPAENKKGLGLKHIPERVRMLGGKMKVESGPGRGTSIEVVIPVKAEAE
jgi:PAS domain S-box-containing protein